jgi:C_GCAxxG_C_C family probable redox protein
MLMSQETRPIDPEQIVRRASQLFVENRLTCSEACLLSGAEALGVESPLLPNIALGLGGGIGGQGDVCGAVAGSAMALSLAAAQKATDYVGQKKLVMPAAARFYRKFVQQCGSARCADICGLDLTTQDGIARLAAGVRDEKCAPAVAAAARILAEELSRMAVSGDRP